MKLFRINLSNPDHCFNIVVLCCSPLFALCLIGLFGSGS